MTENVLWFAPLHGITNYNFRNIFGKHFGGIDCFMSPFIAVQSERQFNKNVWRDIFPENNNDIHLVPQLIGNNPQQFAETIHRLEDLFGYREFNINLGCPSSKVVRHKRGCALLQEPEKVAKILESVFNSTNCKLSLKMRLGLKSETEIFELLPIINDFPLDFLIIHPRIGINLYNGTPDFKSFAEVCSISKHKLIYSGDIFSKCDFETLKNKFPQIDTWMLGRGLLRNPFLAEQIKNFDNHNYFLRFHNFYVDYNETLLSSRPKQVVLSHLKELWHYFFEFLQINSDELSGLLRINDFDLFREKSELLINCSTNDQSRTASLR